MLIMILLVFRYIVSLANKNVIPETMCYENSVFERQENIAETFAEYFSSAYEQSSITDHEYNKIWGSFSFSPISIEKVENCIKKLKSKKSTGCDNIPSYIELEFIFVLQKKKCL